MSTPFNEYWLEMGACVSIDIETTAILLDEIRQLRHDAWLERQWVGLTDEEIKEIIGPYGDTPIKGYTRKLFDRIESKLKEINT